ncbi:MAG TPA: hypothetical protein VFC51_17935 [Chloroflexota bacterium]|nr:hypothetical protein [Chloroflexota bacterium]
MRETAGEQANGSKPEMTSGAPPRVDPIEQYWTNLAANLPPTVRESFLNNIREQHRVNRHYL